MDEQLSKLWSQIKWFKSEEFDDPTLKGSGSMMNIEFVKILDELRSKCGFALPIDSGYRCKDHNAAVGGKDDSAHMEADAADILIPDSARRFMVVSEALKLGIKRIGIGAGFVHLDMSLTLPQGVIWLYPPLATPTNQKP